MYDEDFYLRVEPPRCVCSEDTTLLYQRFDHNVPFQRSDVKEIGKNGIRYKQGSQNMIDACGKYLRTELSDAKKYERIILLFCRVAILQNSLDLVVY